MVTNRHVDRWRPRKGLEGPSALRHPALASLYSPRLLLPGSAVGLLGLEGPGTMTGRPASWKAEQDLAGWLGTWGGLIPI